MSARKNCKHQGFAYAKNGYKNIRIICDYTGEIHDKKYCEKCEYYEPRTPKEREGAIQCEINTYKSAVLNRNGKK